MIAKILGAIDYRGQFNRRSRRLLLAVGLVFSLTTSYLLVGQVFAQSDAAPSGEKIINIYDRGQEKIIVTRANTVRQALAAADIEVSETQDVVEPGLDTELVASKYNVNIYRAKSVTIVDGNLRQRVVTAQQTAEKIAEAAKVKLYPEDAVAINSTRYLLTDGADTVLEIERANVIQLTLFGKQTEVRTRAKAVGDFLAEKEINLGKDDFKSVKTEDKITNGMVIDIWREGKQVITQEEEVDFPVEKINDANRDPSYREIVEAGQKGKRNVTYEIEIRNGSEVGRREIASVTVVEAKKQVEVVGSKPSFDGDFAAALAKLRSCEGGYSSWNPAGPYYGAYQFDQRTWSSVADPAKYGNATPAEQDEAARRLYVSRGWQPWPVCGASLPDIYR